MDRHRLPDLTRRRLALAVPLLGCAGWARGNAGLGALRGASGAVQRDSRALMGTRIDLVTQASDAAAARSAMAAAWTEMSRLSALMSRYDPASTVSAINAAAGMKPVPVPPELFSIFKTARGLSEQTRGAFDITVGALKAWPFEAQQDVPAKITPSAALIAQQQRLVNHRDLWLDPHAGTAFLRRRGMAVDLGGVAKLPILEAGMAVLTRHGIDHAMVNGGGDVLVRGQLRGRPWRVGLRDPRAPERLLGVLALEGQAVVASSGDYERFFMDQGQRRHHILDPATGWPTQGPHGVSLLARDVASVNGLGAAMMVLGKDAARALLSRTAGVDALIVDRDQSVWRSAGMATALA